jgi:hypothetical protein
MWPQRTRELPVVAFGCARQKFGRIRPTRAERVIAEVLQRTNLFPNGVSGFSTTRNGSA